MPEYRRRRRNLNKQAPRHLVTESLVGVTVAAGLAAGLLILGARAVEQNRRDAINEVFVTQATAMLGIDCQQTTSQEYALAMHEGMFDPEFLVSTNLGQIANNRGENIAVELDSGGEPRWVGESIVVDYPTPDRFEVSEFRHGTYAIRVYGTQKVKETFDRVFMTEGDQIGSFLEAYFSDLAEGELHINYLGGNVDAAQINHPEVGWYLSMDSQAEVQAYGDGVSSLIGAAVQLNAAPLHSSALTTGVDLKAKVIEALVNERANLLGRMLEPYSTRPTSEGASTAIGKVAALSESCANLSLNSDPDNPLIGAIAQLMKNQGTPR